MRGAFIMEENNVKDVVKDKDVYKPNREQRRKMAREQRRADKKKHKAVKVSDTKVNSKLAGLMDAIKEKAISVKNETGMDKMYFCFNADNIMDSLIINYEGSEDLKKSLGVRTDITLDNGQTRNNNIVIYVEVSLDNVVNIEDGRGVYLDRAKNMQ